MERLQKTIAKAGIASRRKAEELIVSGKVKVNGVVVTELGTQVSPDDDISVNGVVLKKEEKVYYLLNKPRRVISSVSDEKGRETVLAYLSDVKERIYPVGRLDYDTSGILLLTNDGDFANAMMHPSSHLPKTYEVAVNGVVLKKEEKVYYLLNKPRRVISSVSDEKGRETVLAYLSDVKERIYPVGRLDYDTSGILLLTNDGDFANAMMHPSSHLPKTYEVAVTGVLTDDMLNRLAKGIMLSDGKTLPAEVVLLERSTKKNKTVLHITIQEGRNREVRRMMEYFHCEVTRLNRIGYGFLDLGNLRQGQYRKLRSFEVRKLLAMVKHSTED